jgi:hypothetical protein
MITHRTASLDNGLEHQDVCLTFFAATFVAAGGAADSDVMVTHDSHRGVRLYEWAEDSKHIIFLQASTLL